MQVAKGLNPLGFGAGIWPHDFLCSDGTWSLNPLGFGAGIWPKVCTRCAATGCLNPLGFGAGIWPLFIADGGTEPVVLIPCASGLASGPPKDGTEVLVYVS